MQWHFVLHFVHCLINENGCRVNYTNKYDDDDDDVVTTSHLLSE